MSEQTDSKQQMLTTVDNPFSPFTEFDQWLSYDSTKGYNTCGYLARIAHSSHDISEYDQELAIELAMEEIVRENPYGVHRIVTEDFYKDTQR